MTSHKIRSKEVEQSTGELGDELRLPRRSRGKSRILLGRHEWIALPEFGVGPLHAKSDTGARTSSLHAEDIEVSEDGKSVSFRTRDHYGRSKKCEAAIIKIRKVRSSSGEAERRIFIETEAVLAGGFRWRLRFSLASRSEMRCPMLLGRQGMKGCFVIDPDSEQLAGGLEDLIEVFPEAGR